MIWFLLAGGAAWRVYTKIMQLETIALLSELGSKHPVKPRLVIIEKRESNAYQLKIKGNYNIQEIGKFLKNRFSIEENKNYLIISSHHPKCSTPKVLTP